MIRLAGAPILASIRRDTLNSTHKPFPMVSLLVEKKPCLLIGGSSEALKRAEELHQAGADLRIVTKRASEETVAFAQKNQIPILQREFLPEDLEGVFFVVNTSRDAGLSQSIFEATRSRHCLLATLDDPARSDLGFAAVARAGLLRVGVSTGGASPALAKYLRGELEKLFSHPKTERLLLWMEQKRAYWHQRERDFATRSQALRNLLEGLSIEGKLRYPTKFIEEDGEQD